MAERRPNQIVIAHSSLAEYEFDGDDGDRYYLPARGLADAPSFAKNGRTPIIIVPEHSGIRDLAHFYEKTLNEDKPFELIETCDANYLMDRDIALSDEILSGLRKRNNAERIELYPYGVTNEFLSWAQPLIQEGAVLVGDKKQYINKRWWGHKGGLHRWVESLDVPSFIEGTGMIVAEGFVARNKEEIIKACELLDTYKVMLKPYILSGGFDMKACSGIEDIKNYKIPVMPGGREYEEMPIAVEKLLKIDKDQYGELVYSIQFTGNKLIGRLTRQLVHGVTHWVGNQIPAETSEKFEREALEMVSGFLIQGKPQGPGGIDIISVKGRPVIMEINGGRPTGAHNPKMFREAFAPRATATIFEKEDKADLLNIDVNEAWYKLNVKTYKNSPLAFNQETQQGVYPLVWVKGLWSMLIAFGNSISDSRAKLEEAKATLYSK
ncbi:MAG: hypothetical protein ACD_19C00176G0015 [uncultured bacterium]|nr:MAG: hypothetical protein ACD_19C00176G0015 [uncultured bacterium]